MKIITLTLNPAYDIHCTVPSFRPFHENYVSGSVTEAGGKGVNVSRALTVNGVPNTAFVVLGKQNSAAYEAALADFDIRYSGVYHVGKIRENITIHSEGMAETRFSFESTVTDDTLIDQVEYLVLSDCDADTVVVVSGRIPKGIPAERIQIFLSAVKDTGARIIVDSNSFTVADYIRIKPYLVKPNRDEVMAYTGKNVDTLEDAAAVAAELHAAGIENVMVSMGECGLAYAGEGGELKIPGKKIHALSTIGAGDSTIAGFLCGLFRGLSLQNSVKMGFAFGTASCFREGTLPPLPEKIEEIYNSLD